MTGPARFASVEACADALIERLSGRIRLALPLGLGKPVRLTNALYRRACQRPDIELSIYTALTLEIPRPSSDLENRMLGPLVERLYAGVPELDYAVDLRRGSLPDNVHLEEFYFRPGAYLGVPLAQQRYVSLNYTDAARDLAARGVNVIAHMVAPAPGADAGHLYSLSCNPDVTFDLLDAVARGGGGLPLLVGEVNDALPFMARDAAVPAADFAALVEAEDTHYPLFPVPNRPVSIAEHAIGLRVAALIRDGGTLQVGIGSLGDAVAYAIGLRRRDNGRFRALIEALQATEPLPELDELPEGLYGASEMFVEGFLHLREHGVLQRTVDDGIYLHSGFYLGSARFYQSLRQLSEEHRRGINMTRISFTNRLLGSELTKRYQRRDARFVNAAMMVTLLGAVVSDGLEDGRVVSGVGGQYNFVAMAHELEGARSVIVLPATRTSRGRLSSNIVWNYGHVTIPRHLRDLVVTEYGVADLRGASDQVVIAELLNVADSRFQEGLWALAVAAGKLPQSYRIPERYRANYPDALAERIRQAGLLDALPFYPLGTDFTPVEAELSVALGALGEYRGDLRALLRVAFTGWRNGADNRLQPALERLALTAPRGLKARFDRALVSAALLQAVHDTARPLLAQEAHDARDASISGPQSSAAE